jgi:serine/threonine-protein kinase
MKYRRLAVLRETNSWRIWRGEHPVSHACFTIKEARRGAGADRLRTQLAAEYALFSRLEHPHVLRPAMLDLDPLRLIYEDTRATLAGLLQRTGALEADLVANAMMQCLEGLAYLHEQGLGHGILGTSTIFLAPTGEVKLAEVLGQSLGVPADMHDAEIPTRRLAPELLDPERGPLSPSSDLYCLGFVALEMLQAAEFQPHELVARLNVDAGLLRMIEAMVQEGVPERGYHSAAEAIEALRDLGLVSSRRLPGMEAEEPSSSSSPADSSDARKKESSVSARQRKTRSARSKSAEEPAQTPGQGPSITLSPLAGGNSCRFSAGEPILIGRAEGCDLQLSDENVSKKHALLSCHADGWWLFDLNSRSGTTCNDRQVTRLHLVGGEEVQFGPEAWQVAIGKSTPHLRRGRFELRDLLHRGANGELWRAVWLDRNFRVVALRLYPPEFELDEEQVKRFLRGIEEGAAIHHPNVLRLYWAGTWRREGERTWYLAMEYMAGGSLRDRLAQGRRPIDEVVRYALDVSAALTEAGQLHVVHRNINPSCILFDAEGIAKLGDFSLMRTEVLDSIQQITQARAPLGEQIYQAPEVVRGEKEIGPTCDLYSLAATMYEALCGRPVVPRGLNLPDTLNAICQKAVLPLRTLTPSVPEELAWLVQRCLEKSPGKRIPDAAEFRDRLRRVELEP